MTKEKLAYYFVTVKTSERIYVVPAIGFTEYLFEFVEAPEGAAMETIQELVTNHYEGVINKHGEQIGFSVKEVKPSVKGPMFPESPNVIRLGSRHPGIINKSFNQNQS